MQESLQVSSKRGQPQMAMVGGGGSSSGTLIPSHPGQLEQHSVTRPREPALRTLLYLDVSRWTVPSG